MHKICFLLLISALINTAAAGDENLPGAECPYHLLSFPPPRIASAVPQVGLTFGSRLIEQYVPLWLQDSVSAFLPRWVESSARLSEPVADADFEYERSGMWLMRFISYDSASTQVLLDLRYSEYSDSSLGDYSYVWDPLYVVADLDSHRFHPLVHGLDISLVELFNNAALSCPRAIPRDLICRAMFFLALKYEGQRLSLVRSAQEVAEAYMLQQVGQRLGFVSGDEAFQFGSYYGLDNWFYDKKHSKEASKEVARLPKEYARSLKPPIIASSDTADSVRLWLYAYDCGEVAEWIVTFDKSGLLLSHEYARPPERTISGALAIWSPYNRIEKERKKALQR